MSKKYLHRSALALTMFSTLVASCTTGGVRQADGQRSAGRSAVVAGGENRLPASPSQSPNRAQFINGLESARGSDSRRSGAARISDNLKIHSIPVGAGSCHIVECPGSPETILYDCGQKGVSDGAWNVDEIKEYVANTIRDDQPVVVVSHGDSDHYSLISRVINPAAVQQVMMGGKEEDYSDSFATWLSRVPSGKVFHGWDAGSHENITAWSCGNAEVHMATVNDVGNTNPDSKNSNSLILAIKHGDHVAVLTGDAEDSTQDSAVSNVPELLRNVTLLMASHHGAYTHGSNNKRWADKVRPKIIVYSSGETYGHPSGKIVPNYQRYLMPALPHPMWTSPKYSTEERYDSELAEYVTELNGLIVFESDGSSIGLSCSYSDDCF